MVAKVSGMRRSQLSLCTAPSSSRWTASGAPMSQTRACARYGGIATICASFASPSAENSPTQLFQHHSPRQGPAAALVSAAGPRWDSPTTAPTLRQHQGTAPPSAQAAQNSTRSTACRAHPRSPEKDPYTFPKRFTHHGSLITSVSSILRIAQPSRTRL